MIMKYLRFYNPILILCLMIAICTSCSQKPVKVFILAGQSNMVGHGEMEKGEKGNLKWVTQNTQSPRFKKLADNNGEWTQRNDVFIYTTRDINSKPASGKLAPGFGGSEHTIGPELMFGNVMGDYIDEDVLIIKTAWGGKSLGNDFLSPSAGGQGYNPQKSGDTGFYYKEMLAVVKEVTANIEKYVPDYKGQGFEIVGFGWHQGWNDRVNQKFVNTYTENLRHFINDLRKDLNDPDLPFVMATTSMDLDPKHPRSIQLAEAQKAVQSFPEFKDNIAVVDTKDFWREREISPANQSYHWNRNAESYCLIGEAMGEAMWKLLNR